MKHNTTKIEIANLSKINSAAKLFLEAFDSPKIIAFDGEMGAGKTTFIKALCQHLKVTDTVNSPTFAIVNEYSTENEEMVFHFDLYRLEKKEELLDIGFEDYLHSKHWVLIEWPEIARDFLPQDTVWVKIKEAEKGVRIIKFME